MMTSLLTDPRYNGFGLRVTKSPHLNRTPLRRALLLFGLPIFEIEMVIVAP